LMEWIELKIEQPAPDEDVLMFLNGHIWKGKIWEACPELDPITSPMPTHWASLQKIKNENDFCEDCGTSININDPEAKYTHCAMCEKDDKNQSVEN